MKSIWYYYAKALKVVNSCNSLETQESAVNYIKLFSDYTFKHFDKTLSNSLTDKLYEILFDSL